MNEELIGRRTPIHIRKYDGSYHRRWPARFVMQKGPLYLLAFDEGELIGRGPDPDDDPHAYPARFGGDVYLFEDRWYNVSRMPRDGRTWYYVNIATPVEFDGEFFSTIDLDLDISWYTDADPEVLDEDEFLAHGEAMRYPADVVAHARAAVDEVLGLIRRRAFPFDRR
jgi:protein associated with RNAse G/E